MKEDSTGPRQYTVTEAAQYLQLHPQTIYELVRAKLICHRRKGPKKGRIYFLQVDLDEYLDRGCRKSSH